LTDARNVPTVTTMMATRTERACSKPRTPYTIMYLLRTYASVAAAGSSDQMESQKLPEMLKD
jgi:hypothetical protein